MQRDDARDDAEAAPTGAQPIRRARLRFWSLAALTTVACLVAWAALVVAGTLQGWGRTPLAPAGDARAFMAAATREIDANLHGNVVFRLIERGRTVDEHDASIGDPVDADTLFQVASLSKWVTAWGVMTLIERGKLDLDVPVSHYLTRWSLPPSDFDNDGVTVRRLLSHTAGLTDGLGYGGFAPGTPVQPLTESLTHAADADPGKDGRVHVGVKPGREWRYSGGGFTLLQLLIEEVSGEPFAAYMRRAVLDPLEMTRSTYAVDAATPNVAAFYGPDGEPATHFRFTALAAASLYTTAADMTRFVAAQTASSDGKPPGRGVLRPETLALMRTPHAWQLGAAIWGLGTILYAPNGQGDFIVGHDGNNGPAINTAVRMDPATGDGIVVLETGDLLLASRVAGEWVFWKTGAVDLLTFVMEERRTLGIVALGWAAFVLAACVFAWRRRPRGENR